MNKFQFINFTFLSILILVLSSFSSFANNYNDKEYLNRVNNLNTNIDVRMNDLVKDEINAVIINRRKESQQILGRTSLYFPAIENIIREKNLPDELKYIAVIESSLRPDAVSRQGASGLWQFMKGTGLIYGLKIDKNVDERRDIEKSTHKALDYLEVLYNIYGNWTLALAAYNCGPGNVNKAMKKAGGSTDYWKVAKFLPKETQKYIPKFIAASYLMNYYFVHNLVPIEPADELKFTLTVEVSDRLYFKDLSANYEVELRLIEFLNPSYLKGFIPANNDIKYRLTLPEQAMYSFVQNYKKAEFVNMLSKNRYTEKSTSNVGRDFNNSAKETVYILENKSKAFVKSEEKNKDFQQLLNKKVGNAMTQDRTAYRLKRKESLADISKSQNIAFEDLLLINKLKVDEELALNSKIKLNK